MNYHQKNITKAIRQCPTSYKTESDNHSRMRINFDIKRAIVYLMFSFFCYSVNAQEIMNLYSNGVPGMKSVNTDQDIPSSIVRSVSNPTIQIFLPEKNKANGTAVLICPGGAYKVLMYQAEGINTAKELVKNGVAAIVLKYRLPNDSLMYDKKDAPLQDAQQAIKLIREHAKEWNLNEQKIGVMGFSAGGHLASTLATHYNEPLIKNSNKTSLRPDFQIVVYPVISMQDSLTHKDSRTNLLGKTPAKDMIDYFSSELQINSSSPPAYITHAADDKLVDIDNSINYFEHLRHANVSVEMHIYPKGGHGFILRHPEWIAPLFEWMRQTGLINMP
ncbi:MAG TPA: alpha/beta hydrolase [Pelobium sp.]|nr:alpha/beta hydrolase [Pelobium sp.]